jgi:signal peptidase II
VQKAAHTRNVKYAWSIPAVAVIGFAADRYTKDLMQKQPAERGLSFISQILTTTQHQNYGIIANIPIPQFVIIIFTILSLFILGTLFIRTYQRNELTASLALTLTITGALGNLWDRIAWGYVFDWILLFNRSVLNIADILIASGLLLYVFVSRTEHPPRQSENTSHPLDDTQKTT